MKKQQGFSLIELLIVIGIIGAISAIAVPTYASYKKKSDVTAAVASVKSLLTPAELHLAEGSSKTLVTFVTALAGANSYDVGMGTIVASDETKDNDGNITAPGKLTFTFKAGQSFATSTVVFERKNEAWVCTLDSTITAEYSDIKGCS